MEWLSRLFAPLAAYPRWFVFACLVLVAAGAVWLLAKLVKWTVYIAILLVLLGLAVVVVSWLWG